jgi:hypothetical protein
LISTALLQLDGVTLDNFAELKTVEGLKEGSLIKVSPDSCTVLENETAHFHSLSRRIVVNTRHVEIEFNCVIPVE